ncbi:hypothetical protein H2198_007960 [Neophaeococcomyces mojaviensis]|uniref:Uncharacterized protein n=1 Tax=Neophaeococcomyces mojaviensis TaxID=3383035 RepID=A0ACC2ZZ04_9EURO|nr:hypothetical protein H2198_007960 [Knufia sp. JES_112]
MSFAAKDRFFDQCSNLLKDSSPTVAGAVRHQQALLRRLAGHQTVKGLVDAQSCSACGSINIEAQIIPTNKRKRSTSLEGGNQDLAKGQVLLQKCMTCARCKKLVLDQPVGEPSLKKREVAEDTEISSKEAQSLGAANSAVKISSKKRAKARKEREGLKALLEKQQASSKRPNTFSLMDFMANPG